MPADSPDFNTWARHIFYSPRRQNASLGPSQPLTKETRVGLRGQSFQQQPVRVREVDPEVQPEGLGAGYLCEDSGISLGRADNR